jgi:hypothetical protein
LVICKTSCGQNLTQNPQCTQIAGLFSVSFQKTALTTQAFSQLPHPMHLELLKITPLSGFSVKAVVGHTAAQGGLKHERQIITENPLDIPPCDCIPILLLDKPPLPARLVHANIQVWHL